MGAAAARVVIAGVAVVVAGACVARNAGARVAAVVRDIATVAAVLSDVVAVGATFLQI